MAKDQNEKEKLIPRLRRRYPWFDHLMRANDSFTEHYGNHYAAAITYFSVLSVIPILMVAFAILGIVLAGNQTVIDKITEGIDESVPDGLSQIVNEIVDTAVDNAAGLGLVGIAIALYAGVGWMSNLRDALTAQWAQEKKQIPIVSKTLSDLLSLVGLGVALLLSFALAAAGSGIGESVLALLGLEGQPWTALLQVTSIVLSLLANMLVFMWVIARLPREKVAMRTAVKGAAIAAVGFVVLQKLATFYLSGLADKPSFAVFGSFLGLLVFANLVSRFLLFVTAWTATSDENLALRPIEPPPPAVVRTDVQVRGGPTAAEAAGLLGAGGLLGLGVGLLRRR